MQGTGQVSLIWQDEFGQSVAPTEVGDLFSPFGTQIAMSVLVEAGDGFVERIPMGVYMVAETPAAVTRKFLFKGQWFSGGDRIDVTLKDLFHGVQRDRFDVPGVAPDLSSVYKEIQRLTGLPITKTVPDAPIPASVAYQEDKLQAVYDLAAVVDATACMLPDGSVSLRPNVWPAQADVIRAGDGGSLVEVGRAMANDRVYNKVVIRSRNSGSGAAVLATAEVLDGPLRTRNDDGTLSPYRSVPYFYSSEYLTDQAAADAYARVLLPRVSRLRSVEVRLVTLFNPLWDVGDVVNVKPLGESFLARITDISRTDGRTQTVTVVTDE
ncbi:hypothetical protein [Herbiconiux sp.]|uniref:hypothetical protein n=1 Tax=Herbiconiux sp. TaxID=1871186 RepID=UPI0025C37F19|nr:hypothetical protein [Herbiconiux sp.]